MPLSELNPRPAEKSELSGSGIIGLAHELVETYKSSNELLKKIVEKQDVNEAYIFDILDKWAEERKVKIKK